MSIGKTEWCISEYFDHIVINKEGQRVAAGYGDTPCEAARIARLIAAAPDMLAALEKLARLGNGDQYGTSIGNMIAIEAIREAKGE